VEVVCEQVGPQGALGQEPPLFHRLDLPLIELRFPSRVILVEPARVGLQLRQEFFGGLEAFQVEQGIAVEQISLMGREQNLQEVHSAFGVGGEERGEQVVADVQRVAAFALVPGGSVVGVQIRRDLAGGRQQAIFLLVERVVPFSQQAIDLPDRNVDAQFQQLLV